MTWGNVAQGAGGSLGGMIGGGLVLAFYGPLGWSGLCLVLAGLMALSSLSALAIRGTGRGSCSAPPPGSFRRFLHDPGTWILIALILAVRAPQSLLLPLLQPLLVDQGYSLDALAVFNGFWAMALGIAGALLTGVVITRWGTDFTFFVCVDTLVALTGGAVGGMLAESVGYGALSAAVAVTYGVLSPVVVWLIGPRRKREEVAPRATMAISYDD